MATDHNLRTPSLGDPIVSGELERYRPRLFRGLGVFDRDGWTMKMYGINHDVAQPPHTIVRPGVLGAVVRTLPGFLEQAERAGHHHNVGFVIVHEGLQATWLLTHWWTHQNICCEILASAPVDQPGIFTIVAGAEMACVWELVVIDFERRAWVETVLNGRGGREAYLSARLPDGLY